MRDMPLDRNLFPDMEPTIDLEIKKREAQGAKIARTVRPGIKDFVDFCVELGKEFGGYDFVRTSSAWDAYCEIHKVSRA